MRIDITKDRFELYCTVYRGNIFRLNDEEFAATPSEVQLLLF